MNNAINMNFIRHEASVVTGIPCDRLIVTLDMHASVWVDCYKTMFSSISTFGRYVAGKINNIPNFWSLMRKTDNPVAILESWFHRSSVIWINTTT